MLRFAALALLMAHIAAAADYFLYVGTYTNRQSKGIYGWRFNPDHGDLKPLGLVAETADPSFLAIHPTGRFLYAVNEVANFQGQRAGSISAFAINHETGKLRLLNTVSSHGPGPCHLALDHTGKCLIAANYDGGSIAAFPVREDGRLGDASSFFQHGGTVALPQRQGGPHAHAVLIAPDNRFALVSDLGLDQVLSYRLEAARALLTAANPPFVKLAPGSGPRHLAFHPNGRFIYCINEIKPTISTFSYANGVLKELQTISTLASEFHGENTTAEIVVHPDGEFVYGSNRGEDSIAVFKVDPSNGTLSFLQRVSTGGKTPRNFAIDPNGSYLFAANQNSDTIVLFNIDRHTGRLTPANQTLEAPSPVCLTFVPAN